MILDDIVANKKIQIEEEKKIKSLKEYYDDLKDREIRNFKEALNKNGIAIIAEIKKASPSKGIIKEDFDPVKIGEIYEKINIDAVSILTERKFFKGKDEYVNKVRFINSKPILRKDFIIDEYQVVQARAIGADAILLIAAILGDNIKKYYDLAKELGLYCLTEVHNEKELDKALCAGCNIIGINNRDLKDFTVNLEVTEKLIKYIPKDNIVVSESGIKNSQDIRYLRSLGVNAVLIGETFMRNIDDLEKVKDFINI